MTGTQFARCLADIRALGNTIPLEEQHKFDIRQLKTGGFFRLHGCVYLVLEVSRYTEKRGKYEWFELKIRDVMSGAETFIEWEFDDGLEVWLNEKVSFKALPVSASWISNVWENDDDQAKFSFRGHTFQIEEWDDGLYFRGGKEESEAFRFFDFLNAEETLCLSVEIWDGEFMASVGKAVEPSEVEILSLGGS